MKFAVDRMLGRLAKWLRILGYDTLFDAHVPTSVILAHAKRDGRVFLTRDTRLPSLARLTDTFIVQSEEYKEQLREVVNHFQLDISSGLFTRCTICNEEIKTVEKAVVKDRLPEQSAASYNRFYQCPKCRRVYWGGTHTDNTKLRLKEIFPEHAEG
jgi:uncharacterized protein with PIN domain